MTNQEFEIAVELLRKENIEVVCNIINGLPNETEDDMLDTIRYINKLDIQGVKIHSLLIVEVSVVLLVRIILKYLYSPTSSNKSS